jgi:Zn-dependent peptidase ImmA (M78 family)
MLWNELRRELIGASPITAAARTLSVTFSAFAPVDVRGIARALRVSVHPVRIDEEGILQFSNGRPVILFRDGASEVRQRFTIAHELGHLLLHSNGAKEDAVYFRDKSYARGEPLEVAANRFAANLLMPYTILAPMIDAGVSAEEMAKRFNVSLAALKWQLEDA